MRVVALTAAAGVAFAVAACQTRRDPKAGAGSASGTAAAAAPDAAGAAVRLDAIGRLDFNRHAVRLDIPVYWIVDGDDDKQLDPDEVTTLLFYPTTATWVKGGAFTPELLTAYEKIVAAAKAPPPPPPATDDARRRALVLAELDYGRPTLVRSDFATLPPADKAFVTRMLDVARLVDELYAKQTGEAALAHGLPEDPESRSMFRRNRGPKCVNPAIEKDPLCSALPGAPKPVVDIYPVELQAKDGFCKELEARKDAKELLAPFVVVRGAGADLKPVPYTEAYRAEMIAVANAIDAAAVEMKDPTEQPLLDYLRAAATAFRTNDWVPADEAWAKMSVDNSKWYVRVAPDETYWDPCAQKAGFHLTFARINQGSKTWQGKLVPVQQDMEAAIAARAGAPYRPRKVTFHLPDFIDIIVNAGDDRDPVGATVGQSLPNWGPVSEGRGRTVAMVNLYTDADSLATRRALAESLLDASSMAMYSDSETPGLLATILHEATHNLGPAAEYKVKGKTDGQVFGGPIAAVLEELKAQTGALFLVDFLRTKQIIDDQLAKQSYVDAIVWALGQAAQGMYTPEKERKTYPQLAAIQLGYLMAQGALTWDAAATAANGSDKGAFVIHADKLPAACAEMMALTAGVKARGDAAAAQRLITQYVDGDAVPLATIAERSQRNPRASFVYAVGL